MYFLLVCAIIAAGAILRFVNLSPFHFYPDAYQSLIVARNILNFHSIVGVLGDFGTVYPPFFMWTRPGFPMLINIISIIFHDPIKSAQIAAYLSGITAIPLTYFFIKQIFSSKLAGTAGSVLLALSFNHTVWGGFIYTETTGVLLVIILLWRFFAILELETHWANIHDFILGFIFSLAVFTRFEYIVILIPLTFLILQKSPKSLIRLINFLSAIILISLAVLTQLYPLKETIQLIYIQLNKHILLAFVLTLLFFTSLFIYKILDDNIKKIFINSLPNFCINIIWFITLLIILQLKFGNIIPFYTQFTAARNFFINDLLLGIFTLFGITLMLKEQTLKAYFVLISIIVLIPAYFGINPLMQRYWTHLIPFILIPASYFLMKLMRFLFTSNFQTKAVVIPFLTLLFSYQVFLTFNGIKYWHDGSWFRKSYEQKSAEIFKETVDSNGQILLTSFPEPYFLFTYNSTQSILENDKPPFISLDKSLDSSQIVIIQDIGMQDIFPNFSKFLDDYMQDSKTDSYWVGETYHYSIRNKEEDRPVNIYKTSVNKLKEKIQEVSFDPSK